VKVCQAGPANGVVDGTLGYKLFHCTKPGSSSLARQRALARKVGPGSSRPARQRALARKVGPQLFGQARLQAEIVFLRTQFLKQFLAWRFALSFGLLLGRLLGRYLGGLLNLMVQWLLRSFLAVCLAGRCLAECWVVAGRLVAAFDFRRRFVRPSELGMWTARPVYKSITRNRCCGNVSCHLTSTKPLKCRGKRGSSSPARQRALARACWVSCAILHMSTRRQGSHEPNPSAE
jgi:hypothetical protein